MPKKYEPDELTADDYARAEQLIGVNLFRDSVFGHQVVPHPIHGTDRFWYRATSAAGSTFTVVDPSAARAEPAFDHVAVAQAAAALTGQDVTAGELPFLRLDFHESGRIGLHMPGARYVLDVESGAIAADPHGGTAFSEAPSPDGRHAAFARDSNLYVRDLTSGEERQLTTDGTPDTPYATHPDGLAWSHELERIGFAMPPPVLWADDGSWFVTHRLDNREVARQHYITSSPADESRPTIRSKAYPMPGDSQIPTVDILVVDVAAGKVVHAEVTGLPAPYASPLFFGQVFLEGDRVFAVRQPRDLRDAELVEVDVTTGAARSILTESGDTPIDLAPVLARSNIRVSGDTVVWWSQRDGWGHLYAYDAGGGGLQRQLTSGDWLVAEVLAVDEEFVWFAGMGRDSEDPYRRRFHRVPLNGGDVELLDDVDADHRLFAPGKRGWFVDTMSTVHDWGRTVLRDRDGHEVLELEVADASRADQLGFPYPVRERLLAADGRTEIWATVFLPPDAQPDTIHPVLEDIYPGPQANRAFAGLADAGTGIGEAAALAALGFVVVLVDGRGTPYRSKAFHDHSYGQIHRSSDLDDHVAALRQLAERHPLDLDRVGIFGSSGGGYASTRALLTQPDTYKVAVSACGNHDQRIYWSSWGERYHGMPGEVDYDLQPNAAYTDGLAGKLLLIHGELDDNVSPAHTMRVVDMLVEADADFDMVIVPGAGHMFLGKSRFVIRRRWDHVVRHLLGAEPPAGYHLTEPPLDLSRLLG